MKNPSIRLSLAAVATFSLGLAGCSKKSETVAAPAPTTAAPAAVDPVKAAADAAQAQLAAAKKSAEELEAKAVATAKTEAAQLQALADQKAAEAKKLASDLKAKAGASSTAMLNKASAFTAGPATTTSDTTAQSSTLTSLAQNLNPANFSTWYEQASQESSGIISSLANKAAELGSSASPEFKSLYESTLLQKKNFDDVSARLKSGGLAQWTELYPTLQNSWADLSKSLVTAKSLLAQYNR